MILQRHFNGIIFMIWLVDSRSWCHSTAAAAAHFTINLKISHSRILCDNILIRAPNTDPPCFRLAANQISRFIKRSTSVWCIGVIVKHRIRMKKPLILSLWIRILENCINLQLSWLRHKRLIQCEPSKYSRKG